MLYVGIKRLYYSNFYSEISDSRTAISYLKELPPEKLFNIGLELGLTFDTLKKLSTENFCEEMVTAWLSKEDGVANVGIPTWKFLGAILQKQNLSKVTEMIRKGVV